MHLINIDTYTIQTSCLNNAFQTRLDVLLHVEYIQYMLKIKVYTSSTFTYFYIVFIIYLNIGPTNTDTHITYMYIVLNSTLLFLVRCIVSYFWNRFKMLNLNHTLLYSIKKDYQYHHYNAKGIYFYINLRYIQVWFVT